MCLKEQVRKGSFWGPHRRLQNVIPCSVRPGPQLTQVSVLQYGSITTIDVPWNVAREKAHLLSLVDFMQQEGGPSQVGNVPWAEGQGCVRSPFLAQTTE